MASRAIIARVSAAGILAEWTGDTKSQLRPYATGLLESVATTDLKTRHPISNAKYGTPIGYKTCYYWAVKL